MMFNWPAVRVCPEQTRKGSRCNRQVFSLGCFVELSNSVRRIIIPSHTSTNISLLTVKRSRYYKAMKLFSWTIVFLISLNYVLWVAIIKKPTLALDLPFLAFSSGIDCALNRWSKI